MRLRHLLTITGPLLGILAALTLAFAAPAGAAPAPDPGPTPNLHAGSVCVGVTSSGNWHGTICAMVNLNDAQLDTTAQALVTYSINSGTIHTVYAGHLYSYIITPVTGFIWDERNNPSKTVNSGRSSFLSNDWYGPGPTQYMIQAVVVNPCVTWTNGQKACYSGTIRSGFSGL